MLYCMLYLLYIHYAMPRSTAVCLSYPLFFSAFPRSENPIHNFFPPNLTATRKQHNNHSTNNIYTLFFAFCPTPPSSCKASILLFSPLSPPTISEVLIFSTVSKVCICKYFTCVINYISLSLETKKASQKKGFGRKG